MNLAKRHRQGKGKRRDQQKCLHGSLCCNCVPWQHSRAFIERKSYLLAISWIVPCFWCVFTRNSGETDCVFQVIFKLIYVRIFRLGGILYYLINPNSFSWLKNYLTSATCGCLFGSYLGRFPLDLISRENKHMSRMWKRVMMRRRIILNLSWPQDYQI